MDLQQVVRSKKLGLYGYLMALFAPHPKNPPDSANHSELLLT
jgi:hypothetical protein